MSPFVKNWAVVVPAVGVVIAVSAPLVRYAARERNERTAIMLVTQVHRAQLALRSQAGGFATDVNSLLMPCPGNAALLGSAAIEELARSDYRLELRAAAGARVDMVDCNGRPLATDYFVTATPVAPTSAGRQAVAGRSDGRVYLFYDGLAPREIDIDRGLATPVAARDTFKIP